MSLFKTVRERIIKNKENKDSGNYNGLPVPFPRLSEYVPVFERGMAIGILSHTGNGKSKWLRYTFIYHAYKFYKETGYKIKILYFCMEDDKERVMRNIISHYLKEYHGISITIQELDSLGDRSLPEFVQDMLNQADDYFNEFENVVTLIDNVTEPEQIFDYCKKVALKLGKVSKNRVLVEGEELVQHHYDSDTHVFALFDNMSNLESSEPNSNEQATILKFVKDYMRLRLCNFFHWTCVLVQQTDFESERAAWNKNGEMIAAKVEPGLHSTGDSKRSNRSLHLVFSIFSPARYDIERWPLKKKDSQIPTYDISVLGNRFRTLKILKSNSTDTGLNIGLLFDGIAETFTELPQPDSPEMKEIYSKISGKPKFVKAQNQLVFVDAEDPDDTPF